MADAWTEWNGHVINGEFELKKCLSGSELSAVFLTEDHGQEPQPAAIKLIAANPADAELQLTRWGLAQKVPHPHLLRILHTGRRRLTIDSHELVFAVMEYAEENLAEILALRPLTPQETREMLEPTLDALSWLHSRGFVHGHLKPANVLAEHDQLKLASDGICRAGETVWGMEKSGPYDAPELAVGGVRSPASDVWSLGMLLAEALTQQLPASHQDDKGDPVLPEKLPAPFRGIVRGCLRRDPQRRLTIADIAERLQSTGLTTSTGMDVYLDEAELEESIGDDSTDVDGQPARVAQPVPEDRPAGIAHVFSRVGAQVARVGAQISRTSTQIVTQIGAWTDSLKRLTVRMLAVRQLAILLGVAVLTVAVLVAGFGLLLRRTGTKPAEIKPEQPKVQKPDAGHSPSRARAAKAVSSKTSASKTLSPTTPPKADQQPGAGSDRQSLSPAPVTAPATAPAKPQAAVRSDAQTPPALNVSPAGGPAARPFDRPADSAVVQQVLPDVPQSASDTIHGTLRVSVRVKVDPSGSVVEAGLYSPGPSKYFARLSLEAAQKWKFTRHGPDALREFVLHFDFKNSGARAFATRAAP